MKARSAILCVGWLLQCVVLQVTGDPWKPIVHPNSAISSSSFNVQRTHPIAEENASAELFSFPSPGQDIKRIQNVGHGVAVPVSAPIPSPTSSEILNYEYAEEQPYGYNFGESKILGGGIYGEDHCSLKKFAFNYDGIVNYKNQIPELNQFTICYWMRFTNHTGDHVILTYSAKDDPRAIQFWVANSMNSSFMSMAIKGQQMYRLNYPLRMRQWHHICSSWNGKTGEWQVWIKAERIGRGFHNALVGHKIPANGKLHSGGPSVTGEVSQGLHFEITLVQIYRIALSAGKAHRDHKHHHAHHFDHEGQELTTTAKPAPVINRPQPMHNLLANGQIPTRVRINLAQPQSMAHTVALNQAQSGPQRPPFQMIDHTIHTNFVNGQINAGSRLVAQQLIGLRAGPQGVPSQLVQPPPLTQTNTHTTTTTAQQFDVLSNPANVQFIDETETRIFFKRQINGTKRAAKRRVKGFVKRDTALTAKGDKNDDGEEKNVQKRALVLLEDGSIVDDPLFDADSKFEGLAEFGGQQFKHDLSLRLNMGEDDAATRGSGKEDREPAEGEVKAVMALCSACDVEPFQGAIIFAWKDVKEELDNVLKGYSVGGCGDF